MAAKKRIIWLDPVGPNPLVPEFEALLKEIASPDTEVVVRTLPRGPEHIEYHYYEALILSDLLTEVRRAEKEGFDAAVIGCFYDVGLQEAREITGRMIVVAPAESCTHLACQMGDRFSIIVGRQKWIPQIRKTVEGYGLGQRLASFRPLNMGVLDFQVDHKETMRRIEEQSRRAIEEDGAEVIILGCTAEFGFFKDAQKKLGVPFLDPVAVPFKTAEFQVELRERFGWTHSKICAYEAPPQKEMDGWKLDEQYGIWKTPKS